MSCDLKSHMVQKRLNNWLMKEVPCVASAFGMVVDNYGHCSVEIVGNQVLRCPQNVGIVSDWIEIFQDTNEISFSTIPKDMQVRISGIFNRTELEDGKISVHAIRGRNSSELLGALFIYTSKQGKRTNSSASQSSEQAVDLNAFVNFASTMMRISITFEKQMSRTKLNGFILTLLKNLFSNLENMTQLVEGICKDAKKLIPSKECALYMIDVESGELVAEIVERDKKNEEHLKEHRIPIKDDIVGRVASSGKMINWTAASSEQSNCNSQPSTSYDKPSSKKLNSAEIVQQRLTCAVYNSALCFAVKHKDNVIAVIQLLNKIGTTAYTHYDEDLAELLSSYCAISISHCLLFKKLQEANRRTHVASELMMYHTQKIVEEDVLRLTLSPIPSIEKLSANFSSFFFTPRDMSLSDSQMACLCIFYDLGFMQKFRIKRRKMVRFLLTVEKGYREVPYHNWYHAFTVFHFCYLILKQMPGVQRCLSDIDQLCLLVASLCHDIDHRGTNNSFQLQTRTALAQLYSSEGSILECHHFAQTMCILNIEGCNIFEELPPKLYQMILDKIRDIILATDLAQHFRIRGELENMVKHGFQEGNERHVFLLQSALMTACDLADQTKPWDKSKKSAATIYKEFFSQGDLEKAMGNCPDVAMDRDKADIIKLQLDFLDTIATPLFKMLSQMFPEFEPLLKSITFNRLCYETMQKLLYAQTSGKRCRYDSSLLDATIEKKVLDIVNEKNKDDFTESATARKIL